MSGKGRGRGKISYVQQAEPDFIKRFKEKVGYKEGPTVDTKREMLNKDYDDDDDDDDREEADDEKPVVVVLKKGDLSAEEANRLQTEINQSELDDDPSADGKIKFKKPTKRSGENSSNLNVSTAKKSKDSDDKLEDKKNKSSKKGVTKSSLLSFNEEDEEDDG